MADGLAFPSLPLKSDFILFARLYARTVFLPTLAWNMLLGRVLKVRHWWDSIDENVILGAYPFPRDVAALRSEGVAAVVNTCEEYAGPLDQYRNHGIEQLRIPTTDFTPPKLASIEAAVEFIQKYALRKDVVYIHCKAGRSRSATVALCWLVKYRGMTPEEAQAYLLTCRPHVKPNIDQRQVVKDFVARLATAESESGLFPTIESTVDGSISAD